MINNKKAMSPLFSTIILIGFAIALGGVVMSWGSGEYAPKENGVVMGCEQTSLSLVSYGGNEGVCSKDNILYFTVLNDGEVELGLVKVSLLGDKEIYSSVVDSQLGVADIARLEMDYPDIGKIEKVIFTPNIGYSERLCPKEGFSIERIGDC